jgi:excisionase family DNA binding protein
MGNTERKDLRFLSTNEFIERHGISRSTIYEALKDGSLPHIRLSKSKILIPEDALERQLEIAIPNAKSREGQAKPEAYMKNSFNAAEG